MRDLNSEEIENIDGAGFLFDLGYAVGSGVESVGIAIGNAIASTNNQLKQYMYTQS